MRLINCSKENPWDEGSRNPRDFVRHQDVKVKILREEYKKIYLEWTCLVCGLVWKETVKTD